MIDIRRLIDADKGRNVVYRTAPDFKPEQGTITSWNESFIFVRYVGGSTSAATPPEKLEWVSA